MKRIMSALVAMLALLTGMAMAETLTAPELNYAEKVVYWDDGVFSVGFMRDVAWSADYVLTAADEAGNPLPVSALGGDENEAYVKIDGLIRPDELYTISFVSESGVIRAIGQSTVGCSFPNHCEYCLEFGHDEMACIVKQAAGVSGDVDRCDRCGLLDHDDGHCPNGRCGECGKSGHDDEHCPYDRDDSGHGQHHGSKHHHSR